MRLVLDVYDPTYSVDYFDVEITPEIKSIIRQAKRLIDSMPDSPLTEVVYRCPPFNVGQIDANASNYDITPENVDINGVPSSYIHGYYVGITKQLRVYFKVGFDHIAEEVYTGCLPINKILTK